MDNRLMYFTPAELDYRRQRATHSVKPRRRRGARSLWRRQQDLGTT